LLAAALCFAPSLSRADDQAPFWAKTGAWEVRVDLALGHGCFMAASYDDGTDIRVGLDPTRRFSYIWLGNEKWQSLKPGEAYLIDVAFDNGKPRTWQAGGLDVAGTTFLMLPFSNAEFWKYLSSGSVLHFAYQGRHLTDLPLKGSSSAVNTVFNCQKEFGFENAGSRDPFAGVSSNTLMGLQHAR
jgi:hypothetical protein